MAILLYKLWWRACTLIGTAKIAYFDWTQRIAILRLASMVYKYETTNWFESWAFMYINLQLTELLNTIKLIEASSHHKYNL
jgi:hypothetical protein